MIVNFYRRRRPGDYSKVRIDLLASRNIEHVPALGTIIVVYGQHYRIDRIHFDLENCEYDIFMARV